MTQVKDRLPESLDPKDLDLPKHMAVRRISLEEDVDCDGEKAIQVTVVVADSVDLRKEGNVSGKDVLALKDAIRDKIQEYGREEFAYVDLVSESELAEDTVDPLE
ncbi:MAG: hypothetical protein ACLFV4_14010 [Candidatus Hydrogenedentota bacterium]